MYLWNKLKSAFPPVLLTVSGRVLDIRVTSNAALLGVLRDTEPSLELPAPA